MNIYNWTPTDCLDFLRHLDEASFEVTDWEANFIDSLSKQIESSDFISPKQREVIAKLNNKYGHRLK